MDETIQFNLSGLDHVAAKLGEITDDMKKKGGRFALRKAAQLIRNAARQNAAQLDDPKTPEEIAKNIVERFSNRTFKSTGNLAFRIGVLGGARAPENDARKRRRARNGENSLDNLGEFAGAGKHNPGGDTWYWRLQEFGTSRAPAKAFMRRALTENIEEATNEFANQYERALERAIKRAASKAAKK